MIITFRKWDMNNIYEDDDILVGKMVGHNNRIKPADELATDIKMSPVVNNGKMIHTLGAKYPGTAVFFKSKGTGTLPIIEISEAKLGAIEQSLGKYRYLWNENEKKRAEFLEVLRKSVNKVSKGIGQTRLDELFTVAIIDSDNNLAFAQDPLCYISKAGKLSKSGDYLTVQWEQEENHASGVLFINAYETIHLSLLDAERFARNIEEVYNRAKSTMRVSPDYVVIPISYCYENCLNLRRLPEMTVDEMVIFFGSDRKGTKLDTFVSSIKNMVVDTDALYAIQHSLGKQFYFDISAARNSSLANVKTMPLDSALMLSSYCRIIASNEDDSGAVKLIGEVKETQCDDFANVLYSFMEKNKGNVRVACIDAGNFDSIISHFLTTNLSEKK